MKPSTNIVILIVVSVVAVVGERILVAPRLVDNVESPSSIEGEVLAVDPPADHGAPSLARKATIKLRGGEIVQASVGGCVIFPGQTTRITRMSGYLKSVYVVAENGR